MTESQLVREARLRDPATERGSAVRFSWNGAPVMGYEGESVAAALLASGVAVLRLSPEGQAPRGAFCWMGQCQECVVVIDGIRRPACRASVRSGLDVRSGTIG